MINIGLLLWRSSSGSSLFSWFNICICTVIAGVLVLCYFICQVIMSDFGPFMSWMFVHTIAVHML